MEFAITLVIHRRKESKGEDDAAMKSQTKKKTEKDETRVQYVMKVYPMAIDGNTTSPTVNTFANNEVADGLDVIAKIVKGLSMIPTTHIMDFLAVWIYSILFFVFNAIYWKIFW